MKYTISQFIPIILLFLYFSYPKEFIIFSNLPIGRLLAISFIIFYSSYDKYIGLLICGIIILYYQLECIENMVNIGENIQSTNDKLNIAKEEPDIKGNTKTAKVSLVKENRPMKYTEYNGLYLETYKEFNANTVLKEQFRKQYCNDGVLNFKNIAVRNEMINHVFPEVSFKSNHCNPCDKRCNFSIIESKLNVEEQMKPISTLP